MKKLVFVAAIAFVSCNPISSDSTTNGTDSTSVDTVRYPKDSVVELDTTFVDTIKVDA